MLPPRAPVAPADAAAWPMHGRNPPADPALARLDGFRGEVIADEPRRLPFGEASGILRAIPRAVLVPRDADDVAAAVRWAAAERIPLVPRGAGTGMPGGNVGPGISVDLATSFHAAPRIEANVRTARVEPGITLGQLNAAVAPFDLLFPVDPSSGEVCTLGGMVSNNSGGAHTVRYGSTRAWVESLDVVLADGTRVTTTRGERERHPALAAILRRVDEAVAPHRESLRARWPRVRKNASGYALREYFESGDAVDLLVGSEGTLALVTAATVRLAQPPARRGLALLEFTDLAAAGAAVERILELQPATCEMIDRTFIDLVRQGDEDPGYPLREGLEAILFVEVEGDADDEVEAKLRTVELHAEGIAGRVSLAIDPGQQERFWHVRHAASPLIAKLAGARISMQFIEDGVVPVDRLRDYILLLRRVLAAHELPAVIFGHAGDGNLHVNPLVDVTRPGWREEIERVV